MIRPLIIGAAAVAANYSPHLVTALINSPRRSFLSHYSPVVMFAAESRESALRDELAEMASLVEDEGKYGLTAEAGTPIYSIPKASQSKSASSSNPGSLKQKIDRVKKERAYPLFIAEKAASVVDDFVDSIQTYFGGEIEVGASEYSKKTIKSRKEKVVVLGTGWGAAAFLKDIDCDLYDVTIVSPRNFFLFTPMLAGASVGTVEYRSITEPVREINRQANYLEATAMGIDPQKKTVLCDSVVCEGNSCSIVDFTLEYDRLIVTVGAQTNTFGIPGVREYCCFLKQVEDAQKIRNSIVNCFERANLPSNSDQEKENILTFAVIGAGPTGVEFASELRDFIENDGGKYYASLLKYVRIKLIEASSTVLMPFDKSLQEEAIEKLTRAVEIDNKFISSLIPEHFKLTELLLDSGVSEVKEDLIVLNDGREIPYGLCVWAAGNGPLPITLDLIETLKGSDQESAQSIARGRIGVDPWLRVLGTDGSILAFGDCSCIVENQLPATAQVAAQQGEYLARIFSRQCDLSPGLDVNEGVMIPPRLNPSHRKSLSENIAAFAMNNGEFVAPFQFLNLGILAYTGGGSALAQLQLTPSESTRVKGRGKIGFGLWRSVYLSKQISVRNRVLVFADWMKTQVFGRDITRL